MSSGHSPPTTWSNTSDSMIWASENPRWRLRKGRLASIIPGRPKDRKARETDSNPACALVASAKGRGSRTKGVLPSKGSRADMLGYIEILYVKVNGKNASPDVIMASCTKDRKLGED